MRVRVFNLSECARRKYPLMCQLTTYNTHDYHFDFCYFGGAERISSSIDEKMREKYSFCCNYIISTMNTLSINRLGIFVFYHIGAVESCVTVLRELKNCFMEIAKDDDIWIDFVLCEMSGEKKIDYDESLELVLDSIDETPKDNELKYAIESREEIEKEISEIANNRYPSAAEIFNQKTMAIMERYATQKIKNDPSLILTNDAKAVNRIMSEVKGEIRINTGISDSTLSRFLNGEKIQKKDKLIYYFAFMFHAEYTELFELLNIAGCRDSGDNAGKRLIRNCLCKENYDEYLCDDILYEETGKTLEQHLGFKDPESIKVKNKSR